MKILYFFPGLCGSRFFFHYQKKIVTKNLGIKIINFLKYQNCRSKNIQNKIILDNFKKNSNEIIPILHSISSGFLPIILKLYSNKVKKVILIDSDLIEKNLSFSIKISSFNQRNFKSFFKNIIRIFIFNFDKLLKKKISKNILVKINNDVKRFDQKFVLNITKIQVDIIKSNAIIKIFNIYKNINFFYIYGENSNNIFLKKKLKKFKNLKFKKISNSAHLPMLENHKEFNRLIEKYV